jgi:cytoskeletal protein CcmA (bactofilin family)
MFNSKSKLLGDAPAGANSIIGAGTVIAGNMESDGDIRIDGVLRGNLTGRAKILIGPDGAVEGDIDGEQADVLGRVTGTLKIAGLLNLKGKASVNGDIYTGRLQMEPTVTFNGQCHMGASVVELNSEATAVNQ